MSIKDAKIIMEMKAGVIQRAACIKEGVARRAEIAGGVVKKTV